MARILRLLDPVEPPESDRTQEYPSGAPTPEPGAGPRAIRAGTETGAGRGVITGLRLSGRGARTPAWIEVVAAVTGLPVVLRHHAQAAAVGAALLSAAALGQPYDRDVLDPIDRVHVPDADLVERYRELVPAVDRLASAALGS